MAAALIGKRKIVPALASTIIRRWETTRTTLQQRFVSHCIAGQHVRLRAAAAAAAEKSKWGIPHRRCYSNRFVPYTERLIHPTGYDLFDLAVDKAIRHYNEHVKVEEEDGPGTTVFPAKGVNKKINGARMSQIILKTRGGQKYVSIFVAQQINHSKKLDDEALKLLSFTKVDRYVPSPITKFVGRIQWAVSPRNDPLIMAVAHFALAQHNKEEKLTHLIRATTQMVGEIEIFRMTFKGELSGESSTYDAIVLVPRKNPEKMELVEFGISKDWKIYGRWGSQPPHRYQYDDGEYEYEYEDDNRLVDDPRVTAAARFALAQYNETDSVRLEGKKDRVRRVVEATGRTYSGHEILTIEFEGELDGSSWFYDAIVLVPVDDPENMRLAYCGRNYDDPDYTDENVCEFDAREDGFDDCRGTIVPPIRVGDAAQLALATYDKTDNLVQIYYGSLRYYPRSQAYHFILEFVGENGPSRTYVAMVSATQTDPPNYQVKRVFTKKSSV